MRCAPAHIIVILAVFPVILRADFTPPADGKVTEKQLVDYLSIIRDQSKTDMTPQEFAWVNQQVTPLWPGVLKPKEWDEKARPAIESQIKQRRADSSAASIRLVMYEQAKKNGTRVMTPTERDAAIASATSDRDKLTAEIKTDSDAINPISQEIKKYEQIDTDAEAAAKDPPVTVAEKDRTAFIDARKNEAQAASDSAQKARDHLKEAQKILDDAKNRLAANEIKLKNPEVPATESEKGWVSGENHAVIQSTRKTIADDTQALEVINPLLNVTPLDKADPDNVALAKKHAKDFLDAIGVVTKPPAATQPTP